MSTTGRGRHSVLRIFKGRRGRTGHRATCGALPAAGFESFVEEVHRAKFEILETPRVAYPEELFAKEFDEWKNGGADRYINRIIIQAMTMIPLEDLQGYEDIELDNNLN